MNHQDQCNVPCIQTLLNEAAMKIQKILQNDVNFQEMTLSGIISKYPSGIRQEMVSFKGLHLGKDT